MNYLFARIFVAWIEGAQWGPMVSCHPAIRHHSDSTYRCLTIQMLKSRSPCSCLARIRRPEIMHLLSHSQRWPTLHPTKLQGAPPLDCYERITSIKLSL